MRPLIGIAAAVCAIVLPVAAHADDSSDLRDQILKDCSIKPWQFAVRVEGTTTVIPQISPTLTPDQKKCVLQLLTAFRRDQGATP